MIDTSLRSQLPTIAIYVALASAPNCFAVLVTQPSSLNPGDQYRLAFVTSGLTLANSTNITVYNSFVDGYGETIFAGHDWRAIGSTPTVAARVNTNTVPGTDGAGIPIYRLDGTLIANSYADLWDGTIAAPISLTETGGTPPIGPGFNETFIWTGTTSDGLPAADRWLGHPDRARRGSLTGSWIDSGQNTPNVHMLPLYGISEVLVATSAIPEPSSMFFGAVAISAFGVYRRRRPKRRCS